MEYSNKKQSRANLPEKKETSGSTIFIAVITAIALFTGGMFGYSAYNNWKADEELKKDQAVFQVVSLEKANQIKNESENAMIIIGQKGCIHCENFKPIAREYAKSVNTKFYYVDLQASENVGKIEQYTDFKVDGTPTTFYTQKGKVLFSASGERNRQGLEADINEARSKGFVLPKI